MTELEIEVEKRLRNWSDLKDYPELFSVVTGFAQGQVDEIRDTYMDPWNRTPGDPRYRTREQIAAIEAVIATENFNGNTTDLKYK